MSHKTHALILIYKNDKNFSIFYDKKFKFLPSSLVSIENK